MIEFPIEGIFREPLLVLEAIVILSGLEFGLFFLYRFIKEGKERNMVLAWSVFFLSFSAMIFIFIISDFFLISENRQIIVNIGAVIMGIGALSFTFNAERELEQKFHIFSIILLSFLVFGIIDFFILLGDSFYIISLCLIPFVLTLFIYILKSNKRIKEYRINIYGSSFGFVIFCFGYVATVDLVVGVFGVASRLLGDILIIIGICFISLLFLGLPSLKEFGWSKKIRRLLIINKSGSCLCDHDFLVVPDEVDRSQITTEFMAESLIGINQLIAEIIQSKEKLEILDHQDKKICFFYGDYLIAALIVDEYLEIYKRKLGKLIEILEMIYKDILSDWKGELPSFGLVERYITKIFS